MSAPAAPALTAVPPASAAGTAFADLPEDWVCPLCYVTKDEFSPYED